MRPAHPAAHAALWDRGPSARAAPWRALLAALMFTAGLFVLLPLSGLLMPLPRIEPAAVPVDTIPPPPLPPPPASAPARQAAHRAAAPTPQLVEPRQAWRPIGAPLRVDLALTAVPGDMAVNFPIAPEVALAGSPGDFVFDIAETDRMPRPLARLAPLYPPQARMRRIQGEVIVEFVVTPAGAVSGAEIVLAQPPGVFDQTALHAIQRWRFEPGLKDGAAVAVRVRQKLTFKLEE